MMAYRTSVPSPNQYNHRGSKIKSRREFLWGRREKENTTRTGDFISALLLTAVMLYSAACSLTKKREKEGGKGLAQLIFQEYNK